MPLAGSRPGRAVTWTMAPEPRCRMCGTTAWLSHHAGPRLTSSMSRNVSGVVASASPWPNAPTVFTSTPGAPTSAAIRSMHRVTAAGSAGPGSYEPGQHRVALGQLAPRLLQPIGAAGSGLHHSTQPSSRLLLPQAVGEDDLDHISDGSLTVADGCTGHVRAPFAMQ